MKATLIPLLLAAALTAACGDETGVTGEGRLRVVHLSPDAPPVDLILDGDTVLTDVPYLGASDYLDASEGGHALQVSVADTTTTLIDTDITVADATDYTVLVADSVHAIEPIVLTDDNSTPPAGKARFRVVQGAPSAPAVDIYVTEPGADLTNETPVATDVSLGDVSAYIDADVGTYEVRGTSRGKKDVVIDGTLTVESGQVRTAIAVDAAGGGASFDLLVLSDLN
jgi:hypothetical protein